jgi:hypothetical protein
MRGDEAQVCDSKANKGAGPEVRQTQQQAERSTGPSLAGSASAPV